jgi:hypothetical protein
MAIYDTKLELNTSPESSCWRKAQSILVWKHEKQEVLTSCQNLLSPLTPPTRTELQAFLVPQVLQLKYNTCK